MVFLHLKGTSATLPPVKDSPLLQISMKPLEAVQVLFWLSSCHRVLVHYLTLAHNHATSATPYGIANVLSAAYGMNQRIIHARQNHMRLTWEGGAA